MGVRIVLADDHRLFREGMRSMLSAHPDFEVVGEAEDGAAAIQLAADLLPDLILIDVGLPVVNGILATARILRTTRASKWSPCQLTVIRCLWKPCSMPARLAMSSRKLRFRI